MQFFFILIFGKGCVDQKRNACNILAKQTRESGSIFEIVQVEISILFKSIYALTSDHFVYKVLPY